MTIKQLYYLRTKDSGPIVCEEAQLPELILMYSVGLE